MNTADVRQSRRQRAREAAYFERTRRAEAGYAAALRRAARQIGALVRGLAPDGDPRAELPEIDAALRRYADVLRSWARATAARMIAEVGRRDERAWIEASREMGRDLRAEIRSAPTGMEMRRLQDQQVALITSLPLEAAQRVQEVAREMVGTGSRYDELRRMILATGQVTASRADLIARTEVAKAQSTLTQTRAQFVGSTGYVWRTARDPLVRREHRELEGTFHRWDEPPVAEANGARHAPGQYPNCRCWASPVIPDRI